MVPVSMLQTAEEPDSQTLSTRQERARQVNTSFGRVLRYVGLIIGIVIGWNLGVAYRPDEPGTDWYGYPLLMGSSLGALFFLLTPYLTIGLLSWLRQELRRIEASDLTAAGVGLLIGGLLSTLLALPISMLPDPLGQYLPFAAAFFVCTLAVLSTVTKKRELMDLVGIRRRASSGAAGNASAVSEMLVDTSAIIDGRIVALSDNGFLPFRLVVPQFVLQELQLVADSDDHNKRNRGTRGLKVLEQLRDSSTADLEIRQISADGTDVDAQLVSAARTMNVPVLSGDTNLERVASLQDVRVLNLHNLAEIMRPALTPGDEISLKVVQAGREYQQGVGFLDDGTMIVVDEGEQHIGEQVPVVITRALQTSSGRMMFARVRDESGRS
jgi:uncharacterized protein YacL